MKRHSALKKWMWNHLLHHLSVSPAVFIDNILVSAHVLLFILGFGSTPATPVFGQQPGSGSVFRQVSIDSTIFLLIVQPLKNNVVLK